MAPNRRFELPRIQDLTKEQERVRALPLEGQHLIVGGPGTGKSVVALMRARRLAVDRAHYYFLVYNHLLNRASRQLYKSLSSRTWMRWFLRQFREITGRDVPRLPKDGNRDFREIDWESASQIADSLPSSNPGVEEPPFLVIDEGQDMPPGFYRCLVAFGFENFFVVADQNQQITDENSSREQIAVELDIDQSEVIELRRNFRNEYPIARLAREFYTGDPASPPPSLPNRPFSASGASATILVRYAGNDLPDIARRILKLSTRDRRRLVGVIAPNNEVRKRYVNALKEAARASIPESASLRILTFANDHRPSVRFDQGGILVINAQACKGLEFDTVVCADIDAHYANPADLDEVKKLFYVMVARAKERVILLMRKGAQSPIDRILPSDASISKRMEL